MATLVIDVTYADGQILLASDLDNIVDGIETFLNVTKINDDNIQNGGITGSLKLVAGSVYSTQINGTANITGSQLSSSAGIVGGQLAAATVAGSNIAAATITGSNIAAATIEGSNIDAATITGSNIAATTIAGSNLVNATVTGTQIASNVILAAVPQIKNTSAVVTNIVGSDAFTKNLRISQVAFDGAGTPAVTAGGGATAVNNSAGTYTVTFSTTFSSTPVCHITINSASATGGRCAYTVSSNSVIVVTTYNNGNTLTNLPFSVIAIGQS